MRTIALLGCVWWRSWRPALTAREAAAPWIRCPRRLRVADAGGAGAGIRNDELEVRFVPLDQRVTRLLARDAYESLEGLVHSRRASIDSVARMYGISAPGLALVTFFGPGRARFDPGPSPSISGTGCSAHEASCRSPRASAPSSSTCGSR